MPISLGIDYGTNSVRALFVSTDDGRAFGTGVATYPSGEDGILLDRRDPNLARQHPNDYLTALQAAVDAALTEASRQPGFDPGAVVGIGVDTTGSSPIPVDDRNVPLADQDRFRENLNAQCWLWKDHTSIEEAEAITRLAAEHAPELIAKCGNTYSSEWFWSKIWHCLNVDPTVFDAAHSWVELADFVPAVLCGVESPAAIRRSVCAAGHKALYSPDWGGLPDKAFLGRLDPKLADLRDRLYETAFDVSEPAGHLSPAWAEKLGLPSGIPVAVGAFDAHLGAIGSGVAPGTLVKIIGTSTCDCAVAPLTDELADIPGICGIVPGSVLPAHYGLEAGQSAVGDIFKWWVEGVCQGDAGLHQQLTDEAAALKPGESGLLALDWNNGNRTILVDPRLSGLLLGQTLHTTRAEIYRALIEATAFGARAIVERFRAYGVRIDRIVCCGGIAEKNPMLMQIYADVTGCTMEVAASGQACALGSAVAGAVVAGVYPDVPAAQQTMAAIKDIRYEPDEEAQTTYDQLYVLYRQLHDAFGGVCASGDLSGIMKALINIRHKARRST
ncbi:MAG: ribulokinase [Opitutales bacterium]